MRGSILKKTNSDKWYVVVDYYDATGKRKRKWFSGYTRRKDAENDLPRVLKMMNENSYIEDNGLTVNDIIDQYIGTRRSYLTQTTVTSYESIKRLYIQNNALGNKKITKLKAIEIQNFYNSLSNKSPKTVKNINCLLHSALKMAMKMAMIPNNPADQIELPKIRRQMYTILTVDEIKKVLEYSQDKEYYLPILIAINTGLRRGEINGLMYEDIDFIHNTITVKRQRGKYGLTDILKTDKSYRTIPVSDEIINEIKKNIAFHNEQKKELGNKYIENNYVCKCADGTVLGDNWIYKKWKEICTELGIKNVRFHDLRHTHASLLVNNNVNLKIIQERLGHSNISTTADIYSHPNIEAQRQAIKNLY